MVETLRNENGQMLLLESGGVFFPGDTDFRLSAKYLVRGMDQMGYAAMNLAGSELHAGVDFLREITSDVRFPLLSSNLVFTDGQSAFWKKYVVVDLGAVKVGIVGVMPVDGLKDITDPKYSENLNILPPQTTLEALVPAVRKEVDVIILLSQCDLDETTAMVDAVKGIDFAICPGKNLAGCDDHGHGPQQGETDLLHAARYGVSLGFLQFTVDGSGQAQPLEQKMIPLSTPVPAERLISEMLNEIKKLRVETGARAAQAKAMSTLQLTPQEFIKQMQKEQPGAVMIRE